MSKPLSEVYKPSSGPLMIRDNLAENMIGGTERLLTGNQRLLTGNQRPQTNSGYRFGQKSLNSFFTRHNPHPGRVRHFKGLLDVPICAVNDHGFVASPRYSLQFPPDTYSRSKLSQYLPVNAINVNSQLHPINTITGLAHFTGLRSYPFREKAVPQVGMVPVTETWRDELRSLVEQVTQGPPVEQKVEPRQGTARPRTQGSVYSTDTGRLIPPPSRAMTRQGTRQGNRDRFTNQLEHLAFDPDQETVVLQMLCQILQTDDVNAVKSWLVSAADREKGIVMDLIRTAVAGQEEYYKQNQYMEPQRPKTNTANMADSEPLPAGIGGADAQTLVISHPETMEKKIEKMSLENISPRPREEGQDGRWTRYSWTPERNHKKTAKKESESQKEIDYTKPPGTADAFRQRPRTQQNLASPRNGKPKTPSAAKPATPNTQSAKLKYSSMSNPSQKAKNPIEALLNDKWNPEQSTVS